MTTRDAAVRIKGVPHQFGEADETQFVRALADTSLDIARGELLCLIGPSGCGKSTLLNVIGGLMTPTSGAVEVAGKPVRGPMPQDIAFVFQENALFPWNTVIENVRLGMLFQGVPQSEHDARARQSLEAVGLTEFANHYPSQLSGGMRQRAALARALSLQTGILLMDEPFGALDEQTRMILGEDLSVLLAATVALFSARPGTIKQVIAVDEPHPRKPEFVTSAKFTALRNELYGLLHDEIRKTVSAESPPIMRTPGVLSYTLRGRGVARFFPPPPRLQQLGIRAAVLGDLFGAAHPVPAALCPDLRSRAAV